MKIKKLYLSDTEPALALKTLERITEYPQILSFSPRSSRKSPYRTMKYNAVDLFHFQAKIVIVILPFGLTQCTT